MRTYFAIVEGPRSERSKDQKLLDIIIIKSKCEWLSSFLHIDGVAASVAVELAACAAAKPVEVYRLLTALAARSKVDHAAQLRIRASSRSMIATRRLIQSARRQRSWAHRHCPNCWSRSRYSLNSA